MPSREAPWSAHNREKVTKPPICYYRDTHLSTHQDIGERAFAEWLSSQAAKPETDRNAELIAESLWALVQEGQLRIRPGGYVVKRGHGRLVVEPARKT